MNELESVRQAIASLLNNGILEVKAAIANKNYESAKAAVYHLPNLPYLLLNCSLADIQYYWKVERSDYNQRTKRESFTLRSHSMKYLYHLAIVVCLVNINFAHANDVNDLFEFKVQPDNPQTETRYVGKQTRDFLSIYDTVIKKTIWKVYKGNGNGGHFLLLAISPNANYAVVSHEYSEKGQSLYWVNLTLEHEGNVTELDTSALDELVAKTLKVPVEWLSQVYYDPKKWMRDNTCALVWECTSPGKDEDATIDLHNDGVILLSYDPGTSKKPFVTMGKYVAGMSDEESWNFDDSTLFNSQHSRQQGSTKRKH